MSSSSVDPDDWCLSNAWCYVWVPFYQCKTCGLDSKTAFACKKCGARGNLHVDGCRHRTAIHLDRITWIIHTKHAFPGCGHCMNAIDPEFMCQLPTIVKERFPFVFSGSRHPGIDESLLQMLFSLSSKSVLFGAFSNSVNEVHQIKYSKSMVNYFDCAYKSVSNKERILECEFIPEMFSTFFK